MQDVRNLTYIETGRKKHLRGSDAIFNERKQKYLLSLQMDEEVERAHLENRVESLFI